LFHVKRAAGQARARSSPPAQERRENEAYDEIRLSGMHVPRMQRSTSAAPWCAADPGRHNCNAGIECARGTMSE
jgi:hypothetical protein